MQQTTIEIRSLNLNLAREESGISQKADGVKKHLWNRKEYHQMAELGFFRGKRVELIEGEVIETPPMNKPYATAIRVILEALKMIFPRGYIVDTQLPMSFNTNSEPEPDVAVIKGGVRDFTKSHPKTAELIIEVSDSTLRYDRTVKASLYAKNKIEDYRILNLKNRCLEVYRRPGKDKTLGFVYTENLIFTEDDKVSLLAAPEAKIKIANLLL